jgi:predicted ATPase
MDPELRDAFERLTSDLRTEIQSGDAELRDALGQLATDLRSEIRSGDAELRDALGQLATDLRAEIRSGDAELRDALGQLAADLEAATTEMRRHFDVVGEALRGDIRSLAELMAISNERVGRRMDEGDSRTGGLEGRVLGLEARVMILEDDRKPRRSRRRP